MRNALLLATLLASFATLQAAERANAGETDPRVVKLFGGDDAWAAVRKPKRVEAFRVQLLAPEGEKPQQIGEAYVIGGPVKVGKAELTRLTAVLSEPDTYNWDSAKLCEFEPGVAVRFHGEKATIDVLFCFSCDELQIYRGDQRLGGEDFDNQRPALLKIVQKLFPSDEAIQSLK